MKMFIRFVLALILVLATSSVAFRLQGGHRKTSALRMSIKDIKAREILDSRGNPTVEVDVTTELGVFRASVPSGASTGDYEALELRDKDPERYGGKGVLKAVHNVVKTIGPQLKGWDETEQNKIDQKMIDMDGTKMKSNLGANAILGVSLAVARAGAAKRGVPLYRHFADLAGNKDLLLPVPSFNVINGGAHAANALSFQEFMLLPTGASSFAEAMEIGADIYRHLRGLTQKKYGQDSVNVGDEGGFAPPIKNNAEGVELLMSAIDKSKHRDKVVIGMDVAASEMMVEKGFYDLSAKHKKAGPNSTGKISGRQLADFYIDLIKKYPIKSIEDPFEQDDWDNWVYFTSQVGKDVQVVGDDLTVTNPERIKEAVKKNACNCLLLKVNQIGSVSESIEAVVTAKRAGWGVMTSHRSGETEDDYIADLAVGLCTGQIKTGAPCRSERLSKYNQLLRIEEQLQGKGPYAGNSFRTPSWMGK